MKDWKTGKGNMKFGSYDAEPRTTLLGGESYLVHFPNGYSASIVRHQFSYGHEEGLWEIAVMRDGELDYSTPITDDVLGRLTEEEVIDAFDEIAALESPE